MRPGTEQLLLAFLVVAAPLTLCPRPAAAHGTWASTLGGWWGHRGSWGRSVKAQPTKHEGSPCPHLSVDLVAGLAQDNTLLVATADHLVAPAFGMNWIKNVEAAGITYWLMGALDPEASLFFGNAGVRQCVNSPFGGTLKTSPSERLPGGLRGKGGGGEDAMQRCSGWAAAAPAVAQGLAPTCPALWCSRPLPPAAARRPLPGC
jgi:hypothetical protein